MIDVSIIHCVENKFDNKFERQAKLYLESFKTTNLDLYNNVKCYFLQPTDNDILEDTVQYFRKNQIEFSKIKLSDKQVNNSVNYTNKVVTCDYYSKNLTSKYMCWIDTDVVFLKQAPLSFFNPSDKIVISAFPVNEFDCDFDFRDPEIFDIRFEISNLYQTYFKPTIDLEYRVDKIDYYINSWFVYGERGNEFWKIWKELTYHLLDIVQTTHKELINNGLEYFCEELALSILYAKDKSQFTNVTEFFNNALSMIDTHTFGFNLSEDTVLFHYTGVLDNLCNGMTGNNFKKDVMLMLVTLMDQGKLDNQTFIKINKRLK